MLILGLVACHSNCMRLKQWINKKKTHPLLRLWPHFKHYNPHPPPIRVLPTKLHQSLIVLNNWHPSIDVLVYQERKCKCFFWNYFRTLPASKRLRDLKFQCEVNSSSCTKYKFKIQVHILFAKSAFNAKDSSSMILSSLSISSPSPFCSFNHH